MQTPAFTTGHGHRGGEGITIRDWEEFDTDCREQIYPDGMEMPDRGMAPVLADWPHVRTRRGRGRVERLVQRRICYRAIARCPA